MLAPYRSILGLPGALAFSGLGLLARLEISMVGLGSVLLVQRTTGSYAIGGAVAATGGVCSALMAPWGARLASRYGQAALLRAAAPLHALSIVAVVLFAVLGAATPWLFVGGALCGVTQLSVGSFIRTRWAMLVGGTRQLQVAFALESVLDEVVFIAGPIAVTLVGALLHPAVGLLLAAATAILGAYLLAAQRTTQPALADAAPSAGTEHRRPLLATRGMVVLVLVFSAAGGIFGSAEVTVAAVAKADGVPAAAGLVLALWAAGSLLGGLVYGAIHWHSRMHRRFLVVIVLLALLTLPMVLVTSVPLLAVVFLVAGVAIAPVITTGSTLVESLVPRSRLTEGLAWVSTALVLIYALSAGIAGAVIDAFGPHAGFFVPVTAALLCAVAGILGVHRLRPAEYERRARRADTQGQPSVS
ncbi:MAG: hypothetical protein QOC59_707 [Microbacteriaceae bacterium]|nr:hypothetical protein [Microbacteriaceae bacterium]